MRLRTGLFVGIAFGMILAIGFGMNLFSSPYQLQGSLISPPIAASDFELTDQYGQRFKLSDQHGKLVVIFFGYTNCPDICPTTLSEYQSIRNSLGESGDQFRFLFITVDPERDTPERLRDYIGHFDPDVIGLTGHRDALEPVWKSYGVYQQKQDAGSAAGYLVDHSTRTYVVDQDGNLILTYPFGFDREKIVDDLAYLANSRGRQ
jgi:protein SCO1